MTLTTSRPASGLVFAALLLCGTFAVANDGLTLQHLAELRQVGEQSISPDGQNIAYTLTVQRTPGSDSDGPAWSELHISDREGNSRPFITGEVNIATLHWSADSRHVAFLAKRGDDTTRRVYRIALGGGEASQLITLKSDIRGFSLSPDGQRIALVAAEEEDADLKALKEKGFSQNVYEESWRPNRLWLAELGDNEADSKPRMVEHPGSVQSVSWAPNGETLALTLSPRELIDDVIMRTRIHFASAQTGELLAQVNTPGKLGAMEWSPDGQRLAFIAGEDANDPREGRLMLVDRDGGDPSDLVPGYLGHIWQLEWRDAQNIVFVGHEGVQTRLQEIDIRNLERRDIGAADRAIWSSLSLSADGRYISLSGNTPQHPNELFVIDRRSRGLVASRLSNSNPWLADVRLASQQVIRYAARDGLEIDALLIRPLDEVEGQRYPLILTVHGGPEAHYSNGWLDSYSTPGQAAAARGFAVLYPNYRASTSRGVEFSKLNHGKPAAEEFDDLVDGVDHLIEQGLVDTDRVGITGGSYGGYASAWGATYYSERFAASVMFVGISDKIAMMGTTDIPYELHQVHYLSWPWENWELYRDASPVFHAHKSRTPTLILHGEADPRVDRSQSMILYRYLKQIGQAPVRLVLYPGEGHGNQRAGSRWDYSLRMMRWMEHYLQGEGGEPPAHELDYQLEHWNGEADEDEDEDEENSEDA